MKTIIVSEGQSIIDIALQATGSVEGVFDLLELNGLNIDAALVPGQVLNIDLPIINQNITQFLSNSQIIINTGSDAGVDLDGAGDFNKDFSNDFFK